MRPRIRNILLEPKRFFGDLWQVISWPKIIALLVVAIFFVNLGIFIYDKKNPDKVTSFNVDKIESPYNEENAESQSPSGLFGHQQLTGRGDTTSAPLDAKGVFDKKTKPTGDNLPPIAKIKLMTSSQQEAIYAGDTLFLGASESYDTDGTIKEFRWDFDQSNGLGIDAEGVNATVKYHNPGVYTVTLLIIDDRGAETTTTMSLNVAKQKEEQPNSVVQGLTTNQIDIDSLNFMSRMEVQNALETSYADFTSESYTMLAQSIYNSQKKKLPPLPSLADIELSVGKDPTNQPPVVDSVNPKEGSKLFELRPVISVGFYGNNPIDVDGIELTVDGKPVTADTMKTKYGVQYRPSEDLGYGQHTIMAVVPDERGLKTVKSWNFKIVDPKAENEDLVEKYEDKQGPQIILHNPDKNSKNVKPSTEILVKYDEPVNPDTLEVAVVDMSTNITKFFTKDQVTFDAKHTSFTISPNENIFDFDRAYQIVARQEDQLGNESSFDWYVLGEEYGAPEFEITGPETNSSTNKPQVTVTGFADPTYSITVGDTIAMVDSNGAWKADINLERGKNEVLVVAKDLKGRQSSQYLVLTYDPNANGGNPILDTQESPVIMDASIRDGQTINKIRPQISYVFADTDGIDRDSVVLKVDGVDVTKQSFVSRDSITYKPLEELEQGEHSIQLIVADTKGNTTDYKMKFMVDAYPDQPTALVPSLTNNNENVLLVWDGVTNITNAEYRVFRSTQPNVPTTATNEVKRGLSSTSWIDTDVVDGVKYYYVVTAVTKDGNLSKPSNEVEIRVDFTPPPLQILEPEKNFKTQKDKVTIKGVTEKDATVEVYVNFTKVGTPTLNTDGTFSIEVDLIPEENIITIISRDADGNESIDVRTVTYKVPDVDAPYPADKRPVGTEVAVNNNIVVTYNEPINPQTVSLTVKRTDNPENVIPVNLTDIALQLSKDGKTLTYNPRKDFDYEARYHVEIFAEDLAGNESINDDWDFETQEKDAPALEVISPEKDFFVDKTDIFVTGQTEPNIDLLVRVTTAGGETQPATPVEYKLKSQADGSFKQLVKLYPYKENVITVIATDHLGHSSMQVIEGISSPPDVERPILIVNSPVSNSTVGSPDIEVVGKTDPTAKITVNVNGQVQQDFDMNGKSDFRTDITLNGGQNLIKVIATDKSGNQEIVALTVMYDNIKPLLDVANPIDGLTTNQSKVELRGMTEAENVVATVTLNKGTAQNLSIMPDGTFNHYLFLSTGNNYIVVRGTDTMGNVTTIVRNVYYDPVKGVNGASEGVSGAGADSTSGSGTVGGQGAGSSTSGSTSGTVGGQSTNDTVDNSTGEMNYRGGDNGAPDKVEITPSHGTETNDPTQELNGKTEPEASVDVYQNGKQIYDGKSDVNTGGFSTDVTLEEGKNIFISNGQDASGNRKTELDVVTLDTTGPATTVLAPKVNTLTNVSDLVVYGLTEAKTNVTVKLAGNTKQIVSDEYGYFTTTIQTGPDGTKNLVVEARDKLNNLTTKVVPITVDKTVPNLDLFSLNNQSLVNPTVIPADSPRGRSISVASVTGTIEGRTEVNTPVEVKSNGRVVGTVKSDHNGNFRVNVAFESGADSNIIVSSTDKAGNVKSKYFIVVADKEPPIVNLYAPYPARNIGSSSVTISGLVEDTSNPVTIAIGLNDDYTVKTVTGVYNSFNTSIGGLVEGSNIIHIRATDSVGNTSYQRVSVAYRNGGVTWLGSVRTSVSEDNTYWNWNENKAMAEAGTGGLNYGMFSGIALNPRDPANKGETPTFGDLRDVQADMVANIEAQKDAAKAGVKYNYGNIPSGLGGLGNLTEDIGESFQDLWDKYSSKITDLFKIGG